MISPQPKVSAKQEVTVVPEEHYHCQQFPASDTVTGLLLAEGVGAIRDHTLCSTLHLGEDSTQGKGRGICVEGEESFIQGQSQAGRRSQSFLDPLKGSLGSVIPQVNLALASQLVQGAGNVTELEYKQSIIVAQTQKGLQLTQILWHWPVLHSFDQGGIWFNAFFPHQVAEEEDLLLQ